MKWRMGLALLLGVPFGNAHRLPAQESETVPAVTTAQTTAGLQLTAPSPPVRQRAPREQQPVTVVVSDRGQPPAASTAYRDQPYAPGPQPSFAPPPIPEHVDPGLLLDPLAPTSSPIVPFGSLDEPALRALGKNQPQLLQELHDRVVDLQPDADTRRAIQRVREAVQQTQVGVDVSDEEWINVRDSRITWGGRIHMDWVNWADDAQFGGQENYFEFRRLRLFAAGEGYGVYEYQLELEFAPEIELEGQVVDDRVRLSGFGVEMKDAYVALRDVPWLGYVVLGHFKVPLGLEVLTSSNYITFLERSVAHDFIPGREVGIGAYRNAPDQDLNWGYGAFFYELDEAEHAIVDDNQGTRLVGRVTYTPYYDDLTEGRYLLHTGVGYAYTRPRNEGDPGPPPAEFRPVRFRARPEIHRADNLIDTRTIDANMMDVDLNVDQYHVLNVELASVRGPLSLQSEFIWTAVDEPTGQTIDLFGTYATISYFLTGEHRPYDRARGVFGRVVPYENFWLVTTPQGPSTGWGAWELACRWSYLDFSSIQGQQLNGLTVGMNWYWNPHTRLLVNWIHPFAHNSAQSPLVNAEGDILAMRLQVDF